MRAGYAAKQAIDLRAVCRAIAEPSPMPMAGVQGTRHIVAYVNPAFCVLADKSEEELIGKTFSALVPTDDECLSLLDRVYQTGHAETHIGEEHSPCGCFYWSYTMWPILGDDGRSAAVIIQVTETAVSHRRTAAVNQALLIGSVRQHELLEAANEQLRAELVKRRHTEEVLRRANEDLKQFAFAASHDLQEPLRMVTSYTQLLVRRYRAQLDDQASTYMDFITEGTERMAQLLDDLLCYCRVGSDEQDAAEPIDLNLVLQDVKQSVEIALEETGAIVTGGNLPNVHGHRAHFVQLFQNLIGNAIKYRGERPPRIHISAEERDEGWRFAVADNGIGIAPEYREQIFGVFKRLHGKEIPGTGMGLAICQRVVERYGGRIWVMSEPERGTTFYFTLPHDGCGLKPTAAR